MGKHLLAFYSLMLRPGQRLRLPARSPAMEFHLIEGGGTAQIDAQQFTLAIADTCCAPGCTAATLAKLSASTPANLLQADESPLHRKLRCL